jgi:virginiamycin B lyase
VLAGDVGHLDPLRVEETISITGSADSIVVGEGSVWVLDTRAGTLVRVDPGSGRPVDTIRVGSQPSDVAVAGGWVWVVNRGDGTVSRVDPTTGIVQSVEVGPNISAVAADAETGYIWVAGPEAPSQPF